MIITIVIANSSNTFVASYMLTIVCGIIALIHVTIKPYDNEMLNKFDGIVLQTIIFITALPLFDDFHSLFVITIAFVLVFLPLLSFITVILCLHKGSLKKISTLCTHFTLKKESHDSSNDVDKQVHSLKMKQFHFIIDDSMRKNATICEM